MRLLALALTLFAAAPIHSQRGEERRAVPRNRSLALFGASGRAVVGEGGPTKATDKALLDGLRWLIRHQNADGSWSAESLHSRCKSSPACGAEGVEHDPVRDVALSGLALECFLGAGFSHASRQDIIDVQLHERHNIGQVVSRGLAWLVAQQREDGSFGPTVNGLNANAIAAMVLCEAEGNAHDGVCEPAARKALQFLFSEQLPSPSGRGRFGFGSRQSGTETADVVATAWAADALYSARIAGFAVEQATLDGVVEYARILEANSCDRVAPGARGDEDWAAFLRFFAAPSPRDAALERGLENVLEHLPSARSVAADFDWTRWYFDALLLHQLDHPLSALRKSNAWVEGNKAQVEVLLAAQDKTSKSCRHGAWLVGDSSRRALGPIYSTAMAVRTLAVHYRYAPAFPAPPPRAPEPSPPPKKQ